MLRNPQARRRSPRRRDQRRARKQLRLKPPALRNSHASIAAPLQLFSGATDSASGWRLRICGYSDEMTIECYGSVNGRRLVCSKLYIFSDAHDAVISPDIL